MNEFEVMVEAVVGPLRKRLAAAEAAVVELKAAVAELERPSAVVVPGPAAVAAWWQRSHPYPPALEKPPSVAKPDAVVNGAVIEVDDCDVD